MGKIGTRMNTDEHGFCFGVVGLLERRVDFGVAGDVLKRVVG